MARQVFSFSFLSFHSQNTEAANVGVIYEGQFGQPAPQWG